jgi:hypothetical protein
MMTLGTFELRILRLALESPGAQAARVNDGCDVNDRWTSPETIRYIVPNRRAQIVFALRSWGYLEPHDASRPGLYITAEGRRALGQHAFLDAVP